MGLGKGSTQKQLLLVALSLLLLIAFIGWISQAEASSQAASSILQSESSLSPSQWNALISQSQVPSQSSPSATGNQGQTQSQSSGPSALSQSSSNAPDNQAQTPQSGGQDNQAQSSSQGDSSTGQSQTSSQSCSNSQAQTSGGGQDSHGHHDHEDRAGGNFEDISVVCSQTTFNDGNVIIYQTNTGSISGTFSGTYLTFVNLTMSATGTGTYTATDICTCTVGDKSGTLVFYEAGTLILVNGVWQLYSSATIVRATGDLAHLKGSITLQGIVYIGSGLTIGAYSGHVSGQDSEG